VSETNPRAKADPVRRIVAAVVDLAAGAVVGLIPIIGPLIAVAYWLVRDGLDVPFMDRRSIGKKLAGLRPVRLDGAPMDPAASAARNWVLVIGVVLWPLVFIPVLGWILLVLLVIPVGLAALAVLILETVLALTDDEGRRWGDRLAGTMVIEERA
jgi:uncharacterized RDD family membrane protein YckC